MFQLEGRILEFLQQSRAFLHHVEIRLPEPVSHGITAFMVSHPSWVVPNWHPEVRLPNRFSVSIAGHVGAAVLEAMPEVAASTGFACHSGQVQLSPVLAAMGVPTEIGMGAIRFSLGRHTTQEEIESVVEHLGRALP